MGFNEIIALVLACTCTVALLLLYLAGCQLWLKYLEDTGQSGNYAMIKAMRELSAKFPNATQVRVTKGIYAGEIGQVTLSNGTDVYLRGKTLPNSCDLGLPFTPDMLKRVA